MGESLRNIQTTKKSGDEILFEIVQCKKELQASERELNALKVDIRQKKDNKDPNYFYDNDDNLSDEDLTENELTLKSLTSLQQDIFNKFIKETPKTLSEARWENQQARRALFNAISNVDDSVIGVSMKNLGTHMGAGQTDTTINRIEEELKKKKINDHKSDFHQENQVKEVKGMSSTFLSKNTKSTTHVEKEIAAPGEVIKKIANNKGEELERLREELRSKLAGVIDQSKSPSNVNKTSNKKRNEIQSSVNKDKHISTPPTSIKLPSSSDPFTKGYIGTAIKTSPTSSTIHLSSPDKSYKDNSLSSPRQGLRSRSRSRSRSSTPAKVTESKDNVKPLPQVQTQMQTQSHTQPPKSSNISSYITNKSNEISHSDNFISFESDNEFKFLSAEVKMLQQEKRKLNEENKSLKKKLDQTRKALNEEISTNRKLKSSPNSNKLIPSSAKSESSSIISEICSIIGVNEEFIKNGNRDILIHRIRDLINEDNNSAKPQLETRRNDSPVGFEEAKILYEERINMMNRTLKQVVDKNTILQNEIGIMKEKANNGLTHNKPSNSSSNKEWQYRMKHTKQVEQINDLRFIQNFLTKQVERYEINSQKRLQILRELNIIDDKTLKQIIFFNENTSIYRMTAKKKLKCVILSVIATIRIRNRLRLNNKRKQKVLTHINENR